MLNNNNNINNYIWLAVCTALITISLFLAPGCGQISSSTTTTTLPPSFAVYTIDDDKASATQATGTYTSLGIDSCDHVYVSYIGNGCLKYAEINNATWETRYLDSGFGNCQYTSLVVDKNDKLHIGYSYFWYYPPFEITRYVTNTSGSWVISGVGSGEIEKYPGWYVSLALDSNLAAHLCFMEADDIHFRGVVKYATNASGSWVITPLERVSFRMNSADFTSIALDSHNYVHICYYYRDDTCLRYATNSSGTWEIQTVDNAGNVGYCSHLAVDRSNKVHISYYDATNGTLKYATNASGSWVTTSVDYCGGDTSLVIDNQNQPHISYYDYNSASLKYARYIASSWETYVVDTDGVGMFCSLGLDSHNKAHFSYFDYSNTVLKYAVQQ